MMSTCDENQSGREQQIDGTNHKSWVTLVCLTSNYAACLYCGESANTANIVQYNDRPAERPIGQETVHHRVAALPKKRTNSYMAKVSQYNNARNCGRVVANREELTGPKVNVRGGLPDF